MSRFVFSADAHITEPGDLFVENLPASMHAYALRAEVGEGFMQTMIGDQIVHRLKLGGEGRSDAMKMRRAGSRDLKMRVADMEADGVDGEICYPSLGLMLYHIADPDAELATAQIYNDWTRHYFDGYENRFVRCGILPVRRLEDTMAEMKRVASFGITSAMLPAVSPKGVPTYNLDAWDPVFQLASDLGMVFVFHTGTGGNPVIERGAGGAIINYTHQMTEAQDTIMRLVSGGILERFPKVQTAFIESGASWLAGLSERMDEVFEAHHYYVRPKLSLKPSEYVRRQVKVSFQYDRGCVMSRSVTGHEALMFASDYPHMEGTFPQTRKVIDDLFVGIDIPATEQRDILGGTAARLFKFPGAPAA